VRWWREKEREVKWSLSSRPQSLVGMWIAWKRHLHKRIPLNWPSTLSWAFADTKCWWFLKSKLPMTLLLQMIDQAITGRWVRSSLQCALSSIKLHVSSNMYINSHTHHDQFQQICFHCKFLPNFSSGDMIGLKSTLNVSQALYPVHLWQISCR